MSAVGALPAPRVAEANRGGHRATAVTGARPLEAIGRADRAPQVAVVGVRTGAIARRRGIPVHPRATETVAAVPHVGRPGAILGAAVVPGTRSAVTVRIVDGEIVRGSVTGTLGRAVGDPTHADRAAIVAGLMHPLVSAGTARLIALAHVTTAGAMTDVGRVSPVSASTVPEDVPAAAMTGAATRDTVLVLLRVSAGTARPIAPVVVMTAAAMTDVVQGRRGTGASAPEDVPEGAMTGVPTTGRRGDPAMSAGRTGAGTAIGTRTPNVSPTFPGPAWLGRRMNRTLRRTWTCVSCRAAFAQNSAR